MESEPTRGVLVESVFVCTHMFWGVTRCMMKKSNRMSRFSLSCKLVFLRADKFLFHNYLKKKPILYGTFDRNIFTS